jgi:phage-related baseplate assembly protein
MQNSTHGIDLSLLPPPDVVEPLDFETILAERKARFLSLLPEDQRAEMAITLTLETEPVVILLQEMAYQELLLRSRINDAARQCMLASARGSNLEHLAAYFGVQKLTVDPGDTSAIPPVQPTMETDTSLRARTQLALEGMSTAGPTESYRFHALSAHGGVEDASITSPEPGQVLVSILGRAADGLPEPEVLKAVEARLCAETIRPLDDEVLVRPATIVPFAVEATITLYPGPSSQPVIDAAQVALTTTLADLRRIGFSIPRSAIFAALHQPGVQSVDLTEPPADIPITATQCGLCTQIDLRTQDN